jgi:hypothetical protein
MWSVAELFQIGGPGDWVVDLDQAGLVVEMPTRRIPRGTIVMPIRLGGWFLVVFIVVTSVCFWFIREQQHSGTAGRPRSEEPLRDDRRADR